MSYQVLARKWRPQIFANVVGQKHVLTALENGLSLGRIHHAYIFSGIRGIGKTTIARLLAKGLNCNTGITATPCGICNNCNEIARGSFVDLIEIDAASRTKVEDTRDLLDHTQYFPVQGRFKIYLIDEVHMLSRNSFSAMLKTLEEPPPHIKFLLATTEPKKLPMTILSRCIQFHLKALSIEEIRTQLKHILESENVVYEPHALQLLARAADGSLRDALSMTDQAIIRGNNKLSTESVRDMLGMLDDDQALSLIESVIKGDGERTLSLINIASTRGIDWETLLIDMLAFLHRIAMLQLSSSIISVNTKDIEQRLRTLSSTIPPEEIQLYYQILLIGRKELPFAPDRRMGVEMTLLRALAFQPRVIFSEQKKFHQPIIPNTSTTKVTKEYISSKSISPLKSGVLLSDTTNSVLSEGSQIPNVQDVTDTLEKSESVAIRKIYPISSTVFEPLTTISKKMQKSSKLPVLKKNLLTKRETSLLESTTFTKKKTEKLQTLQLKKYEKTPKFVEKLVEEAIMRDIWAEEVSRLQIPPFVEQIALNTWKEQEGNQICLHLRSEQRHLNSPNAQRILSEAISKLQGVTINLTIVEDNDFSIRTPMEWRRAIYEEKLAQARKEIITDNKIQILRQFFDADLDEESISLF